MSDAYNFWVPEPLCKGRTVFIIGGGPSLRGFEPSPLVGHYIIAINSSYRLVPNADMLFFSDTHWWEEHGPVVMKNFKGLIVTTNRRFQIGSDRIKRVQSELKQEFAFPGERVIRQGRTSGHSAISLAITMGAPLIVLLGFDMRRVGGRSHHHNDYFTTDDRIFSDDFIPKFDGWNEAARNVGVTIVNATPGSALKEFQMVSLEQGFWGEEFKS